MKSQVWCTQFTSWSSVDMRNISNFLLLLFKTIKITTNKPMLSIYFLPSKVHKFFHFLLEILFQFFWSSSDFPDTLRFSPYNCYIYSIYFCFKRLIKTLSMVFFFDIYYTFITYDRRKSNKQRAKPNEQRSRSKKFSIYKICVPLEKNIRVKKWGVNDFAVRLN